ncbi:MAG: hypothetical protein ACOYNF_20625, partial [Rhodoferax sp.]
SECNDDQLIGSNQANTGPALPGKKELQDERHDCQRHDGVDRDLHRRLSDRQPGFLRRCLKLKFRQRFLLFFDRCRAFFLKSQWPATLGLLVKFFLIPIPIMQTHIFPCSTSLV